MNGVHMHIFLREDRRDDLNGLFESSKACVKVAALPRSSCLEKTKAIVDEW